MINQVNFLASEMRSVLQTKLCMPGAG